MQLANGKDSLIACILCLLVSIIQIPGVGNGDIVSAIIMGMAWGMALVFTAEWLFREGEKW